MSSGILVSLIPNESQEWPLNALINVIMENNRGYVHYNSLNTIIQDLFDTIRNSNIAESENISKNMVEQWVHQYRSLLLKQDLDKGRYVNQTYVQEINGIIVGPSNTGSLVLRPMDGIDVFVSEIKIPKTIDLQFKSGIISLTTIDGREIQVLPESRALRQFDRKWTKDDTVAFLKEDRLYLLSLEDLEMVNGKFIFEVPTEIGEVLTINGYIDYNRNDVYHIPANLIPTMKEMILKRELMITIQQMPDIVNDGTESSTIEKQEYSRAVGARKAGKAG
jgi:hypothetical protein